MIRTAKIFVNGRSQAVRLPKEFQFKGKDVYIQKLGDAVILVPRNRLWETFLHGLNDFTDDFLEEGRDQGDDQARNDL